MLTSGRRDPIDYNHIHLLTTPWCTTSLRLRDRITPWRSYANIADFACTCGMADRSLVNVKGMTPFRVQKRRIAKLTMAAKLPRGARVLSISDGLLEGSTSQDTM